MAFAMLQCSLTKASSLLERAATPSTKTRSILRDQQEEHEREELLVGSCKGGGCGDLSRPKVGSLSRLCCQPSCLKHTTPDLANDSIQSFTRRLMHLTDHLLSIASHSISSKIHTHPKSYWYGKNTDLSSNPATAKQKYHQQA